MMLAPPLMRTDLRPYVCAHCHVPGVSPNPNRLYCDRGPCQEAKREARNEEKRARRAKAKR